MQVEENEQNLLSKEEAFQKIMVYTGGRCAEELIFNSITSVRATILNKPRN